MAPHFEGDISGVPEDHKDSYGVMMEGGEYFVTEADGRRILKRFESMKNKRQEFVRS